MITTKHQGNPTAHEECQSGIANTDDNQGSGEN
jgi:hypothetical protein